MADAGTDITVDQGDNVTFDGTGSTDDTGIANYTWSFTDCAIIQLYGAEPDYTFMNAGIFVVTLNVTDEAGNWHMDSITVTVNDITDPMADAGANLTVEQGSMVTLNGSRSTDNVGIVNYVWTFEDEGAKTLYGLDPKYNFTHIGTFNVTLNVTDAAGNWHIHIITVTVEASTLTTGMVTGKVKTVKNNETVNLTGVNVVIYRIEAVEILNGSLILGYENKTHWFNTTTVADGSYNKTLAFDTYRMYVEEDGYEAVEEYEFTLDVLQLEIVKDFVLKEETVIVEPVLYNITGKVTPSNATVTFSGAEAVVMDNGMFTITGVEADNYTLTFNAPGHKEKIVTVTVGGSDLVLDEVELEAENDTTPGPGDDDTTGDDDTAGDDDTTGGETSEEKRSFAPLIIGIVIMVIIIVIGIVMLLIYSNKKKKEEPDEPFDL